MNWAKRSARAASEGRGCRVDGVGVPVKRVGIRTPHQRHPDGGNQLSPAGKEIQR